MLELVEEETEEVVIVNVAFVAAAGTTTLAGTCAAAVLLPRVTVTPPLGAGPLSVTVPCEFVPPATLAGFKLSDATVTPPFIVTAPTAIVGTVAAYWRLHT